MNLKLNRPLCFFDLETTGTQIATDRIVEIGILKVFPNGSEEVYSSLVNPEIPIPPATTAIHGITDADVSEQPPFAKIAKQVYQFIKDSDLAGFNSNRFDVPLLAEELLRADIDFDFKNRFLVDVQVIFHKMEKRNLEAAYKFYCGAELKDAHRATADAKATYEVMKAQLQRYDNLQDDVKLLSEFTRRKVIADLAGFIMYDKDGAESFSFGKHKGKKVEQVLEDEPGYFGWLMKADFPRYTKKILTAIKLRKMNTKTR